MRRGARIGSGIAARLSLQTIFLMYSASLLITDCSLVTGFI